MKPPVSDIAFTPSVKAMQVQRGSRTHYARMEEGAGWSDTITPELYDFLKEVDSIYLATASADGEAIHPTSRRPQRVPQSPG